jgi:hypothetical protein
VIIDAMIVIGAMMTIVIEETIVMAGTGLTTSPATKVTAMGYQRGLLTPNVVKATIRSDHTIGETEATVTTRAMETEASTNRSSVMLLSKATVKGINATVVITGAVTMAAGEMAARPGPGK